jgi:capsular polysaccharide biosynthesis protein
VTDIASESPTGVVVLPAGPRQRPFSRPPPKTLDPNVLRDFAQSFNLLQDISADGDNMFTYTQEQYVAVIPNGMVEGEAGLVFDAAGHVYHLPHLLHNRTTQALPKPQLPPHEAALSCQQHYTRLGSVIQRYGHMYYHFLVETLPRIIALQAAGALTPETKLLTWGQPYEMSWLALLGVTPDQVVAFDPEKIYCANQLLVPTPVPRITPAREVLVATRQALGIQTLPKAQRELIVYVSREGEPTRRVANEAAMLDAIKQTFPLQPLVVFRGGMTPLEAIDLFQRASVVVGPHGAGLSHLIFSAPGTSVVEFIFLADPPLMFWHAASALGQEYWALPVPQSYYMQPSMEVPIGEVIDILHTIKNPAPAASTCAPGMAGRIGGPCLPCPPGSYAYTAGSLACKICPSGRVAGKEGSSACSTCKPGTYASLDASECRPCPSGKFSVLAGASSEEQCLEPETRRRRLEEQTLSVDMMAKLSPMFSKQLKRRALIQGTAIPISLTPQEMCTVQSQHGMSGPYAAPYMLHSIDLPCHNETQQPIDAPVLPPVDVSVPPAPSAPKQPSIPPSPDSDLGGPVEPDLPQKRPVLDTWAWALIATASAMVVLPLLVYAGKWCAARRRRTMQSRAAAAALGASAGRNAAENTKQAYAVSNPMFDLKASSTSTSSRGR